MTDASEPTPPKTALAQAWKPGQSGNPNGRPKGSRNKLSEAFLRDLSDHWSEHGKAALNAALKDDPAGYVRVVASILPKQAELISPLDGLDSDKLERILARLDALLEEEDRGGVAGETGSNPDRAVSPVH